MSQSKKPKLNPPVPLDKDTARHWKALTDQLDATGNLADTDLGIILLTASTQALLERVVNALANADLVDEATGKPNGLLKDYSSLSSKLTRLLRELKLTPSTRGSNQGRSDDPLQTFLRG